MPIDLLEFIGLVITGFTSCAEFGSYAFVHPVIRRLPREHHVSVEKGLLKTFGRVMPVLMTLCVVLSFAYAMQLRAARDIASIVRWTAALVFLAALVSTLIFNVPTNLDRAMGPSKSSAQLEANAQSVGVLSRASLVAAVDRLYSSLSRGGAPALSAEAHHAKRMTNDR